MNHLKFSFYCSLIVSVFSTTVSAPSETDTLVHVHVLFRHGNRTPDIQSLFPNDPHINETYEPFGYSQLTTKGKRTEYELGQFLRQRYDGFIPAQYTPNVVYAISTNFKRTKMSLELVLAGLFPPQETDIFYEGLNWQPVPFNVEQDEHLIGIPLIYCSNFNRMYYSYMLSKQGQSVLDTYREFYDRLSEHTGLEVTTPEQVLDIFETLESEEDFGLVLPEWTIEFYPEALEEAASLYFDFATVTPSLRRLTNGNLLKKILEDSLGKQDGRVSEEKKVSLYSAHDFHVSTMLSSLNLNLKSIPAYGSAIIFEIHNVGGVFGLKLYYRDYREAVPKLLTIPGCSDFCEIDKFGEIIADNLPGAYDLCTFSGELM